jgi:hypothetical protein
LCWTWSGIGSSFAGTRGLHDFATLISDDAATKVDAFSATVQGGTQAIGAVAETVISALHFPPIESGGWLGLGITSVTAGLVTSVAEALGIPVDRAVFVHLTHCVFLDLGDLDDNLTLPILSGGCIWAMFKTVSWLAA